MIEYSDLLNNLPKEERLRLMSYMTDSQTINIEFQILQIEFQILQIEQKKLKAIKSHRDFLDDCNNQIKNLKSSLARLDK